MSDLSILQTLQGRPMRTTKQIRLTGCIHLRHPSMDMHLQWLLWMQPRMKRHICTTQNRLAFPKGGTFGCWCKKKRPPTNQSTGGGNVRVGSCKQQSSGIAPNDGTKWTSGAKHWLQHCAASHFPNGQNNPQWNCEDHLLQHT